MGLSMEQMSWADVVKRTPPTNTSRERIIPTPQSYADVPTPTSKHNSKETSDPSPARLSNDSSVSLCEPLNQAIQQKPPNQPKRREGWRSHPSRDTKQSRVPCPATHIDTLWGACPKDLIAGQTVQQAVDSFVDKLKYDEVLRISFFKAAISGSYCNLGKCGLNPGLSINLHHFLSETKRDTPFHIDVNHFQLGTFKYFKRVNKAVNLSHRLHSVRYRTGQYPLRFAISSARPIGTLDNHYMPSSVKILLHHGANPCPQSDEWTEKAITTAIAFAKNVIRLRLRRAFEAKKNGKYRQYMDNCKRVIVLSEYIRQIADHIIKNGQKFRPQDIAEAEQALSSIDPDECPRIEYLMNISPTSARSRTLDMTIDEQLHGDLHNAAQQIKQDVENHYRRSASANEESSMRSRVAALRLNALS